MKNWNPWIRQGHRWLSIAFTLGVIVNTIAKVRGIEPAAWVYLSALLPLALLLLSGLYLFALPYAARWRGARPGRRAAASGDALAGQGERP